MKTPQSPHASRLRQRKRELLRRLAIPIDGLPGTLTCSFTRCGKPSCHCAKGEGHPSWTLTYMASGRRHTERVPQQWVAEVTRRVEQGREFKQAVAEVFAANAQLLVLARKSRRR